LGASRPTAARSVFGRFAPHSRALRAPDPRLMGRGLDGRCLSLSLFGPAEVAVCLSSSTPAFGAYGRGMPERT
jgi:hypothetical protein